MAEGMVAEEVAAQGASAPRRRVRPLKVVGIVVLAAAALVAAVVIGLNIYVRTAFAPFFAEAEPVFAIPGVQEGFICQDLDHLEADDCWLFSGYVTGDGPSPLYRRDADGTVACLQVENPDGTPYVGHGSAITSAGAYAYLACEGGYLVLDAEEVGSVSDGGTVSAISRVDVDFSPAFMNIEGDQMLLGNFYYPGDYETPAAHRITTPDGAENPAVVYAFPLDPNAPFGVASQPARVYSIPGMIQGVCTTDDGRLVLSQSYGIATSHLLAYDTALLVQDGVFSVGGREVPLYCLDGRSLVEDVQAPPMTEGIESYEGRVYVSEESASNKYLFGKLYGAGMVYALSMNGE
ncbi:hypothetical protein VJ918_04135 [Adlercreutzia sp. R21]|uniref:hypothetical protein n=1 Tax=Adlercreutzia wanghongyangiae TaxID=3111451 RepID=UPI002DB7B5CB|nr:hypothetical protein [Adlercreutzia sp. R21]MEC4183991.1 hypothetical protein [Adlercreutzia sp. R21]